MRYSFDFHADPRSFLDEAGALLSADPVRSTVVATLAVRVQRDGQPALPADAGFEPWWLVVRDADGSVVGAGMRTAVTAPYPPYLLPMPERAAAELAAALVDRGERVAAVTGALPAVEVLAGALGGPARVTERTVLYELDSVVEPPAVPGRLRLARAEELDLVQAWFTAFGVDAAAQAGRDDPHPAPLETRDSLARRIEAGDIWLREDAAGTPVQVTGVNQPSFGVARIGPVYTPPDHRGHGYAAAAVAELSARLAGQGLRVCLFTDAANPVSNRLYQRLGYVAVARTASVVLDEA